MTLGLQTRIAASPELLDERLDQDTSLCSDRAEDQRIASEILSRIEGLGEVDAGWLARSRMVEGLRLALIGINLGS